MHIDIINDHGSLDKLEKNWSTIYKADKQANFYLSWTWMRTFLSQEWIHHWLIVAVAERPGTNHIAYFPFYLRNHSTELVMAGHDMASYTGFICHPDHEKTVLPLIADFIQNELHWEIFLIDNTTDPRTATLLDCFAPKKFRKETLAPQSCPYVELPDTWEAYLEKHLSQKGRYNLRKSTRRLEEQPGFRTELTTMVNYDTQMEAYTELWKNRWRDFSESEREWVYRITRACLDDQCLYMPVIWINDTPVATVEAYLDTEHKVIYGVSSAWNKDFARMSPGLVLLGISIRHAIENGYRIYDLQAGDQAYKYSMGAEERAKASYRITRRDLSTTIKKLKRNIKTRINRLPSRKTA